MPPSAPPRAPSRSGSPADRSTRPSSSEPTLSPAVGLHVAKAAAPARRIAEVKLLHVLVVGERFAFTVHHHAPVLEDVAVIGIAQRDVGVLLGEQEAHPFL